MAVLDGEYRCGADGVPAFVEASAPTDDDLNALLRAVIARLMQMLTRRGVVVQDMGQTYLAEPDADGEEARTLRPPQAAAVTYRIAFGARTPRPAKGFDSHGCDATRGHGTPVSVRRH